MIAVAGFSMRTYYYQIRAQSVDKDASIKRQIRQIFHQHKGCYGYPRITAMLNKKGIKINHKKVYRLMKAMGLKAVVRRKKRQYFQSNQGLAMPNLLQRNFTATAAHQRLVTDITEFKVRNKKLYLSPIMDLFNREIVAFSLSESPNLALVMTMLEKGLKVIGRRSNAILHSDQGWQYRHLDFQAKLKSANITQSMSRKGTCLDNAAMESFFAVLKTECFHGRKIQSIEALKQITIKYIRYYNYQRIKQSLNNMSPVEYRLAYAGQKCC